VQQLSDLGGIEYLEIPAKEPALSLAKNIEFLKHLPKLNSLAGLGRGARHNIRSPLVETRGFGTNPGALRMFSFVPGSVPHRPALVVVLHGCGQTATGYDLGAGWSTLAKRYGFALLMPEQQPSNNAATCFNWFNPEDTARDQGEACSIRNMIMRMVAIHGINRRSIYVTGLSAGGAMTSVMLATYPELFAAGAVIAGLPFGVAGNMREALRGMMQSAPRPASELGDAVRNASRHKGPWPKVSVWHGSADRTVNPGNADEIVKQWLDVHHLPLAPMSEGVVDGYPRQIWWNGDGETVVESYTITNMAHGTPLGTADNGQRIGAEGAFLIEAGISSSYHIANFFGLTERVQQPKAASPSAQLIPPVSPMSAPMPDLAKVLWPLTTLDHRPKAQTKPQTKPPPQPNKTTAPKRRGAIDVGAVITRALTAAGLIK
jgi:poly(hydroxyalkanoate) depolymerase family esterase